MNLKNKFNLEGKVAFISGGSRGLGKACALALAEFGASIALGATDEEKLIEVSGEIKELGSKEDIKEIKLLPNLDYKMVLVI